MAVYELLIRGAPDGRFVGAHQIDFTESGGVTSPRSLEPAAVSTILGEAFPALAIELEQARKRIQELETTPPSPPPRAPSDTIDWLSFMALFTREEQEAVALSTDKGVAVFRLMATGVGDLHLDHPSVAAGLDALIAAGCIAPERKSAILARQAP